MKLSKVFSIVAIAIMLLVVGSNMASAISPANIIANTSGTGDIANLGGRIIGVIQTVGTIVAIAVLVVLGIKYMMGSAEEKAEYKKTMIPYVVGAVLIFAASNIAGFVYTWASSIK